MRTVIAIILGGILLLGASPAGAVQVVDKDTGYGRAHVAGWSRGYGHAAIMAKYHGHGDIDFTIRCNNGYTNQKSWTDGGPYFRYNQHVPASARCNYSATISSNSYIAFILGVW